jgi:DNA-binding response OmpR family regulator
VHILVIEDERTARNALIELLKKEGHTVCWAARWDTGIAQMRREKPNLVLLDMMIAETGGWKIVRERFDDPALRNISMIILSGTSEDDIRSRGLAGIFAGGSVIMNKPYRAENLVGAIDHIQATNSAVAFNSGDGFERLL